MSNLNFQSKDTNRKASQIYTLVKADLDREAEQRLREFEPDVVTALISEDYLFSRRTVGWMLELSIWVLVAVMLSYAVGIGAAIIAGAVFLGFVITSYIVKAIVNVAIEGFHYKYQPRRVRDHIASRTRVLACRILGDTPIGTSNVVGVLLLAAAKLSRHNPAERNAIELALKDQLMRATAESMALLSREQRDALHYRFMTIADLLETVRIRRHVPDSDASATLGVSILKAYEHTPASIISPAHIHLIRKVAAIKPDDLPSEWEQVVSASNHALLIMGQPLRKTNGRDTLLRGSNSGVLDAQELLRPTDLCADKSSEELVRVAE